jgi:hypothetical protein
VLHPAVEARLRDWWRAPRVLPFPVPPSFGARLAEVFRRPLTNLDELQSRLGLEVPLCRSAFQTSAAAGRSGEAHFCATTYENLVGEASKLCELTEPIPLQSAGTDDTLKLPRSVARALLAAMLLGMPPPLPNESGEEEGAGGAEAEDTEDMLKPRDCRHLWSAETPDGIRALRAALACFDPATTTRSSSSSSSRRSSGDGSGHVEEDTIVLQRCVLAKEVDFAARSPRPMQPFSLHPPHPPAPEQQLQHDSESSGAASAPVVACRVGRFACGGGGADAQAVTAGAQADVALRPELLVGALLCPALRRDEAMVVSGTMLVTLGGDADDGMDGGSGGQLQNATVSVPAQTLMLIDFGDVSPPPAAAVGNGDAAAAVEGWLARVRRDLEKSYCAFAAGAQTAGVCRVSSSLTKSESLRDTAAAAAGGDSVAVAVDADAMSTELVMQWLAASEAGCALELNLDDELLLAAAACSDPAACSLSEGLTSLQRELSGAATPPTVGWVWARLQEYATARLGGGEGAMPLLEVIRCAMVNGAAFPTGTAPSVRALCPLPSALYPASQPLYLYKIDSSGVCLSSAMRCGVRALDHNSDGISCVRACVCVHCQWQDLAAVLALEAEDAAALAAGIPAVVDDDEEESGSKRSRGGGARGGRGRAARNGRGGGAAGGGGGLFGASGGGGGGGGGGGQSLFGGGGGDSDSDDDDGVVEMSVASASRSGRGGRGGGGGLFGGDSSDDDDGAAMAGGGGGGGGGGTGWTSSDDEDEGPSRRLF